MAEPFSHIFRSKFVNFHVGPERTNFTMHAQPFAGLSQVLNTLINGDMVEAKTGVIDWKDVDEETFVRFCEFAYVQDYTPPRFSECSDDREEPKQVEPAGSWFRTPEEIKTRDPGPGDIGVPPEDEPVEVDIDLDSWSGFTFTSTKKNKKKRSKSIFVPEDVANGRRQLIKSQLHNLLSKSDYSPPSTNLSFRQQFEPVLNTSPHQDFVPVFLGHARLYVLADKYDVRELGDLVLHKLYSTLKEFTLYEARIADVMELVRFAYDNTPPSYQPDASAISQSEANLDWGVNTNDGSGSDGRGPDPREKRVNGLRKLVTQFVVSKLDAVAQSYAFLGLLHDGGEFVEDFWTMLWNSDAWVA